MGQDKTVEFDARLGEPVRITGDSSDTSVMAILALAHTYEPFVVELLRRVIAPGDVVLDVGANIGVLTVVAAKLCQPGHVYAFEPSAHHARFLHTNLEANGVANVTIEQVAVSDQRGEVVLNLPETYQAGAYVTATHHEGVAERVRTTTLDDWAQERGIDRCDFVKIDVEGCERLVLAGGPKLLERYRPMLLVECNAVTQRRFRGEAIAPLYDDLKAYTPDLYALQPGGSLERILSSRHLDRLVTGPALVDVLCVPRTRTLQRSRLGSVRALRNYFDLALHDNRWRRPSRSIAHDPDYRIDLGTPALQPLHAARGDRLRVPLTIRNTGRLWLSDAFTQNPMYLSYRWIRDGCVVDDVGGPRTSFGSLQPHSGHRTVELEIDVDREPGDYVLDIGIVQEHMAWLVELAPELAFRVPISVT